MSSDQDTCKIVHQWRGKRSLKDSLSYVSAVARNSISHDKDIFFVQLGAMDGHTCDPIFEHASAEKWKGVAVDAAEDLCEKAKKTYEKLEMQIECITAAVGAIDGEEMTFYRVNPDFIEEKNLPHWVHGIGTFLPQKNAIFGRGKVDEKLAEAFRAHVVEKKLKTFCIDTIFSRLQNPLQRIDVLSINLQGFERIAVDQLDFRGPLRPFFVVLEHQHLSAEDRAHVSEKFKSNGYALRIDKTRIHALDYRVIWIYWEDVPNRPSRSPCLDICEKTIVMQRGQSRVVKVTPQNLRKFISEGLPKHLYKMHVAERADYIRVRLVAQYGGAWCDTDTILLQSFDTIWKILEMTRPQIATWSEERIVTRTQLSNGFFCALPGSFFLLRVLETLSEMLKNPQNDMKWGSYGGKLFNKVMSDTGAFDSVLMLCEMGLIVNSKPIFRKKLENSARRCLPFTVDDQKCIVVPLYHTLNNMRNIDEFNLKSGDSILKEWLLRGLHE